MKDNPYSKMIEMMNKRGGPSSNLLIGHVITSNPLTVKIGDLQISRGDIFISDHLLNSYRRTINIPGITSNSAINFLDGLMNGDMLAVFPTSDNQKYIVIARLVRV